MIDDILEKERIGTKVSTILFLFPIIFDVFIEGIENSISPWKKIEMVEGNILSKIKQGIENNVIMPKMFNKVLKEYEMICFISFAKEKLLCLVFIFSRVSWKERIETSSFILNEEI